MIRWIKDLIAVIQWYRFLQNRLPHTIVSRKCDIPGCGKESIHYSLWPDGTVWCRDCCQRDPCRATQRERL